ncbi:hypothetical protein H9Q70_014707, partial [Fusarium xylarioides]
TVKGPTFDRIQQEVNSEYENEYAPLRKLVQGIKKQYAPSDVQVLSALRREYHLVLRQAKYASMKPMVCMSAGTASMNGLSLMI